MIATEHHVGLLQSIMKITEQKLSWASLVILWYPNHVKNENCQCKNDGSGGDDGHNDNNDNEDNDDLA